MNTRETGKTQTALLPAIRMYASELENIKTAALAQGIRLSDYVRQSLANALLNPRQSAPSATITTPSTPPTPLIQPEHTPIPKNRSRQFAKTSKEKHEKKASRRIRESEHVPGLSQRLIEQGGRCSHNFLVLPGGMTACPKCKV